MKKEENKNKLALHTCTRLTYTHTPYKTKH